MCSWNVRGRDVDYEGRNVAQDLLADSKIANCRAVLSECGVLDVVIRQPSYARSIEAGRFVFTWTLNRAAP